VAHGAWLDEREEIQGVPSFENRELNGNNGGYIAIVAPYFVPLQKGCARGLMYNYEMSLNIDIRYFSAGRFFISE